MPNRTSPHSENDAWVRLRHAVAAEYIAKLPELLSPDRFARLAGLTIAEVRAATMTGELIVSLRDGHYGIAPADNVAFLLRERLLRLVPEPAPAPRGRPRPARTLEVSTAAYERVWEEAVRAGISPGEVLDRLLLGS